jgi:hypothetical protein
MSASRLNSLTISYFSDIFLTPRVRKIMASSLGFTYVSSESSIFLTL